MSVFTACQYNMGKDAGDYLMLCRYKNPSLEIKSDEDVANFKKQYRDVSLKASMTLLQNPCDIYCLQEVDRTDRPLINALRLKGFTIIHYDYGKKDRYLDSVVAFNAKRFNLIRNGSTLLKINNIFHKDVAIALVQEKTTKKNIAIASLHVPGFQFTKKVLKEEDIRDGSIYCRLLVKALDQSVKCHKIICADMNTTPEKKGVDWFQLFSKAGYQLLRTKKPTNVNSRDKEDRQRELDYMFYRPKSLSHQGTMVGKMQKKSILGFDEKGNASDHIPVQAKFTIMKD